MYRGQAVLSGGDFIIPNIVSYPVEAKVPLPPVDLKDERSPPVYSRYPNEYDARKRPPSNYLRELQLMTQETHRELQLMTLEAYPEFHMMTQRTLRELQLMTREL